MPSVAIVGAGISGLATAFFLRQLRPDLKLTVLEKGAEPGGGKVRSSRRDGFTFDWGPNGFLTNAPETLALADALGLSDALLPASRAAGRRYLFRDGALKPLPTSPLAFLRSDLVSPTSKVRALLEPLLARREEREESVYRFLERHFGVGVARAFADPLVVGITAGDASELSVDALFPHFRAIEREHGSLVRGLIAAQRRSRREGGPRTHLASFRNGGIQRLIDALTSELDASLRLGAGVIALERSGPSGYLLRVEGGGEVRAERVVLAVPAFTAARLLEPHLPEAARQLAAIPYTSVQVFGLGFDQTELPRPLDGFGFLTPRGQGVRSRGVLWSSSVFPDQAPEGKVMVRVIAGGTADPDFTELSTDEALTEVRRDLEVTMGITAAPSHLEMVRWRRGIPQYLLGHQERLRQLEATLTSLPGVVLTGNAYRGVGLNDCVRDAGRVATALSQL